jgi:phosphoglycerol transferase MdoB-like AlkP superfamily enzyme
LNGYSRETTPDSIYYHEGEYADYALGKFIEQANGKAYFDNTIILIVYDHNSRVKEKPR